MRAVLAGRTRVSRPALPLGRVNRPQGQAAQPHRADPFLQTSAPTPRMPAPATSFEGISNVDQGDIGLPPDSDGAVGPNHFVQWINTAIAIYSRTGSRLVGPTPGNTLWQTAGFTNPYGTENDGDPVVLYDRAADRWFLTQ